MVVVVVVVGVVPVVSGNCATFFQKHQKKYKYPQRHLLLIIPNKAPNRVTNQINAKYFPFVANNMGNRTELLAWTAAGHVPL